MAGHFLRSKIIPVIPNISETAKEKIIICSPRATRGSPQPGWIKFNVRTVVPATISIARDKSP